MKFAVEYVEQNKQSSALFIAFNNDMQHRPWQHRRMVQRLCLAVLLLTSVGCGGGKRPGQQVAVEDIWRALSASEAAAMDRYGGRPLLVEGTVDSVSNPGGARPTFWLRTPDVRASAPAFIVGEVGRPSSGSRVILRCEYLQHVAATPYFYSCEIAG